MYIGERFWKIIMKRKIKSGVIWITGLSGSGKTTIASLLYKKMKEKFSNIKLFDGDKLRKKLRINNTNNSFTYASRKKIGLKYSKICKKYENKNFLVIISVMALISSVNKWNKKNFKNYFDVYLKVPLYELKKRDPKKLYRKYYLKKVSNVAGLDLNYNEPLKPKVKITWKKNLTANKITNIIFFNFLKNENINNSKNP